MMDPFPLLNRTIFQSFVLLLTRTLFSDGEYVFVDPESKVGKYAPKAWKTSQSNVSRRVVAVYAFREAA